MRICLIIFLLLLHSTFVCGKKQGQSLIDSLLNEIPKEKDDSNKVNLLNYLSESCIDINPDNGMHYVHQGLMLAERLKWKGGIAHSYNNLGQLFYAKGSLSEALEAFNHAVKIYEELRDTIEVATIQANIGIVYDTRGDNAEALKMYLSSLEILKNTDRKQKIASIYNDMGLVYSKMGRFSEALKNYFSAIKINEDLKSIDGLARAYINVGMVYFSLENFPETFKYDSLALKLFASEGNKNGVAHCYRNIASIYGAEEQYSEAIRNYHLALDAFKEIKDSVSIASSYCNLGLALAEIKNYKSAIKILDTALAISAIIGDTATITETYLMIGTTYNRQNSFDSAKKYLSKGLLLAKKIGQVSFIRNGYNELSLMYSNVGNYKDALQNYREYIRLNDSLINNENAKKLVQAQMQYSFDKIQDSVKALHDKALAVAAERTDKEIALNRKQRLLGIIIFVAIIIIVLIISYFYTKRKNDLIKNKELEYKARELEFQNEKLEIERQAIIAQLDVHFVAATVSSINKFIQENDKQSASKYLLNFYELIRAILKSSVEKRPVTLKDELTILDNYIQLAKLRFTGPLQYFISVDNGINKSSLLMPPMIFQTLVENAIGHAFDKSIGGTIRLEVHKKGNKIECFVEDNGKGREAAKKEQQETHTSLGTDLIEKWVKLWNEPGKDIIFGTTDLYDTSGIPSGTRVEFVIPYQTIEQSFEDD